MTADCLKLTSYFGERHRSGGSFTADALIELYGRHEIAASILLRGTEGFGLKHHLRTDRSLTLSEDLPLIAIAVDTRSRIETVLAPTVQLNRTGLVTLERARLLTDVTGPGWSAEDHEAAKLTIYLGRQERVDRVPAFIAVCDLLHRRGIDGATALLGVDGTAHGRRERAAFFSRNAEVPMMVIAVGSGERIGSILPELGALLQRPLLTLERVRICKRDGLLLATPPELPGADDHGMALWHKLMVYTSEAVQYHGEPIHRAIVRRLRSAGLSGATTQRGIWGFHGDHPPHGDRLLQLGRHVPAVTIVIDTPERISAAFAVIDELTSERGLVTSETIPALRASAGDRQRGGTRLATHHLPPTPDPLSSGGSVYLRAGQSGSVNRGGRWPNSAATASAWFGRPMRAPISCCSAAKPVSKSTRPARSSSRLAARMASGLRPAMLRASSRAAWRGSGSTLVARPSATASSPRTTRPEKVSSLATSRPTSSGSSWLPVMSGTRPHLISSTDIRASGATMRMSAPSAICRPPPSALPVTAAMTGTGISVQTYAARCPVARAGPWPGGRSTRALSRSPSRIAANEPKSRPAQKSGPSPDSTTARTPGSDLSRSPAVTRPANIAPSRALRLSGRASRTSATPLVISTVTRCSVITAPSHTSRSCSLTQAG
jgi:PII-like signaling protein